MFNAGDIIGERYHILNLLGQGSFAQVWEVFDKTENNIKALEVLTQEGDKAIELFEQEAATLSQLVHPGIPKFFPYFEKPKYCFVMEKIEGCNLEEVKANSVSPLILINWLKELVNTLICIHRQNPQNKKINEDWANLLRFIGLNEIATQPIHPCCSATDIHK